MSERDVLAALSAATVGSRELDEMIARAAGWYLVHAAESYSQAAGDQEFDQWHEPDNTPVSSLPEFSDSLDAALTLVPEGWHGTYDPIFFDDGGVQYDGFCLYPDFAKWTPYGDWIKRVCSRGKTAPLALCLAALRARQSNPAASEGEGKQDG